MIPFKPVVLAALFVIGLLLAPIAASEFVNMRHPGTVCEPRTGEIRETHPEAGRLISSKGTLQLVPFGMTCDFVFQGDAGPVEVQAKPGLEKSLAFYGLILVGVCFVVASFLPGVKPTRPNPSGQL